MTPRFTRTAIVSLLLAAPFPLAAQQPVQPPPGMVPLELVQALLPDYSPLEEGPPTILVGSLPPRLAELLPLPPGARVLGSVVYTSSSRAVIELPEPRSAALTRLEEELRTRGWTEPATAPGFQRAGFQTSQLVQPRILCAPDGRALNFVPAGRAGAGDGGPLQVWYHAEPRLTPCNVEGLRQRHPAQDIPIPALAPPAGVRVSNAGTGGGIDHRESRARAHFAGTSEALVTAYAEQLRAAGWEPGSRSGGPDHAVHVWRFRDAQGEAWQAVLVALPLGDGVHDLFLRVVRPGAV